MSIFITALAAATLTVAPTHAAGQDGRTVIVRHADLDLGREADRAALNRRIAAATEQVCGSYAGARQDEELEIRRCRAGIARDVARQLGVRLARR